MIITAELFDVPGRLLQREITSLLIHSVERGYSTILQHDM